MGTLESREVWSEDRVYLLAQCFAEGGSMEGIAKALGGFEHCEDDGRSAVIGKVNRLRASAESDAERTFWTRERPASRRTKKNKKRSAAATHGKTHKGNNGHSSPLSAIERDAMIDSVPMPVFTVTDAEVQEAFVRQLVTGRAPEFDGNWSTKRLTSVSMRTETIKCTETVAGMVPCGKPCVARTARCVEHGGNMIALIKLTGVERMEACAREPD